MRYKVLVDDSAVVMWTADDLREYGVDVQTVEKTVLHVGRTPQIMLAINCESSQETFQAVRDKFGYRQMNLGGTYLM